MYHVLRSRHALRHVGRPGPGSCWLMSIMIYEAFEVTRGQATPISHPVIPGSWIPPVEKCMLWV
jgi:hypothetical protein